MTRITEEMWLQTLLRNAGTRANAFDGLTTQQQRKEHFRGVIRQYELQDKSARANDPTFGKIFADIYGESL